MSNPNIRLTGTVTELMTSYNDDGSLDNTAFRNMAQFQVREGINGFFVNGVAGESTILSAEDKAGQAKIALGAARGNIPVFANIMVRSVDEALELLREYEKTGIDGIYITSPCFYVHTEEALFDFFKAIITATDKTVHIYNAKETSNLISPSLMGRLVNEFDNVWGYKDSTQDIIHLQEFMSYIKKSPFDILSGSDATIYPTLALGGTGIISLISLIFPKLIIKLVKEYESGNLEASIKLQFDVLKLRQALKSCSRTAGYAYLTERIGIPIRNTKLPPSMMRITEAQKKAIDNVVEELNLI